VKEYQETDRAATQYLAQKSILKSESLDVKLQLAQAQNQMITLQDDLEIQKEHLNDLLARDLDTVFRTQPVPPATPEEMELKQAREAALQQRPEIKEAQIHVDQAGYLANLEVGDIIISANGKAISSTDEFRQVLAGFKPGDAVVLTVDASP